MVANTTVQFPELGATLMSIDRVTRKDANVYLDAQAMAEALFNDHMATNFIMVGAAYQTGALPISAGSLEAAIRLNGVSVDMNLLAFRWGRMAVVDAGRVEAAVVQAHGKVQATRPLSAEARALVDAAGATGEVRRLLEIRVPELIAYQDAAYARQYVDFVGRVVAEESRKTPGRTGLAEAVARHLFKLMAYKDEYEVARLHLAAAVEAELHARFGQGMRYYWHLHPPLLRALGLKQKIRLGSWFRPAFQALRAMKGLRGTALDLFGYARVRREERSLIAEYRALIERALGSLSPATHDTAVAIGDLPDVIRGYEDIKLDNVRQFRARAAELAARLN
jgi:indolepyruvate ferredoxin oxidoreductase